VVDADSALGIHVGPFAMRLAVEKAKQYGVGTVTVFNHGHLGGAGYHAKLAADAGCIGHCLHGPGGSQVYPTFGAEPRFGTHPIAWAAPAGKEEGFLFDISTAQVAGNKMTLARRLGVQLAENWIVDDEGTPIDEVYMIDIIRCVSHYSVKVDPFS
jgi:LDH2 family malate/lactate/ureidoglycolate dehydrogenase